MYLLCIYYQLVSLLYSWILSISSYSYMTKVSTSSCGTLVPLRGTSLFPSHECQLRAGRNGTSRARKALGEGPLGNSNNEPNKKKPKEFSQKEGRTKSHNIARSWLVEILIQANLDDIRRFSMSS